MLTPESRGIFIFSIDLQWKGHDTDLTLDGRYKKSEIHELEVFMPSWYSPSVKVLRQILSAGHDHKLFGGKIS